jgi:hypothetical protein
VFENRTETRIRYQLFLNKITDIRQKYLFVKDKLSNDERRACPNIPDKLQQNLKRERQQNEENNEPVWIDRCLSEKRSDEGRLSWAYLGITHTINSEYISWYSCKLNTFCFSIIVKFIK